MLEFFSGKLRIQFQENGAIAFRAIGENGEDGVEDALAKIQEIETYLRARCILHEAHIRDYGAGGRTDAIAIAPAHGQAYRSPERRRGRRRHNDSFLV